MAEPFLSEIKIVSFNFAPKGWALCDGQIMPISQNQALFALLGTTFGGDGQTTFALPDLRGRTPIHVGSGHTVGERGGEAAHTLTVSELPQHIHVASAANVAGSTPAPTNNLLAQALNVYRPPPATTSLHPESIANAGGSQAHQNMQPFLTVNFCIALQGIFPSPN